MKQERVQTEQDSTNQPVPKYPEVGVIAFVPDTWGEGVWQLRQQVLTRLADYFNVVWVDPVQGWRESIRATQWPARMRHPRSEKGPTFSVYRHPKYLPKFYRPRILDTVTDASRLRTCFKHLRSRGCRRFIGYLWRPEYAASLFRGDFDRRFYHIDDEYSFSDVESGIDDTERRIIHDVDEVFLHSPAMLEKKGGINPNSSFVPNGVDYLSFASERRAPSDLSDIPRPIVGYVGVLQSTIDWQLVSDIARKNNNLSFVFVGPEGYLGDNDKKYLEKLRALSNCYFLGARDVDELPAYVQQMSVCLMPYKQNDYTKYIFPLKANEYLAAGRPTIGTPIRSLQEFSEAVHLATTSDEWTDAIRILLATEEDSDLVRRRQEVACRHDWSRIVEKIATRMRQSL